MEGISSNLKDEIKKTGDRKNKEKFRFITAILITNIMVAILCLPSDETSPEIKKIQKTLHGSHQMMALPLNVLVTSTDNPETPVSLISKDKKMVIEKAYLHEALKTDEESTQFNIEIKNDEVVKISEFAGDVMLAVPFVQKKKIKVSLKRESKYEVSI